MRNKEEQKKSEIEGNDREEINETTEEKGMNSKCEHSEGSEDEITSLKGTVQKLTMLNEEKSDEIKRLKMEGKALRRDKETAGKENERLIKNEETVMIKIEHKKEYGKKKWKEEINGNKNKKKVNRNWSS